MQIDLLVALFIAVTIIFYLLVLLSGRVGSGRDFYVNQGGISPLARGMGLAADWFCAATFLSLFGFMISSAQDAYWMMSGWLLGLIVLSIYVAPSVHRSRQTCLVGFLSEIFPSKGLCYSLLLVISLLSVVLLSLQIKGVGLIFSRYLQVPVYTGMAIAVLLLFFYTALSSLKAITRVQMLQLCIIFCSLAISTLYIYQTQHPEADRLFIQGLLAELLSNREEVEAVVFYTGQQMLEKIFMLLVLAAGVSTLPYLLKRFLGAKMVTDIKYTAIWMLLAIGVIYGLSSWIADKTEMQIEQTLVDTLQDGDAYSRMPNWFFLWEYTDKVTLIEQRISHETSDMFSDDLFNDELNGDVASLLDEMSVGEHRIEASVSEFSIADDIKLLVMPELYDMPDWVVAFITVGVIAALLSTASMLLIATIHSLVLQSGLQAAIAHEKVVSSILALLMLASSMLIASILTDSLIHWFNRVVLVCAATLFPAFVLALLAKQLPAVAVTVGLWVGFISSSGYVYLYDYGSVQKVWPGTLPYLQPVSMALFWMLLNVITVLLIAWLTSWRRRAFP